MGYVWELWQFMIFLVFHSIKLAIKKTWFPLVRLLKEMLTHFKHTVQTHRNKNKVDDTKIEKQNMRQTENKVMYEIFIILTWPDSYYSTLHYTRAHTDSAMSHWGHEAEWIKEDRAHTFSVRGKLLGLQRKGSDVGAQHLDGAQHPGGGLQGGEGWTGWAKLFRL